MLYDGEIWVQARPQRTPFRVVTPTGVRVQVVGTEFLVAHSKQTTQTRVTVVKGAVRVFREPHAVVVRASQQSVLGPTGPPSLPYPVQPSRLARWALGETVEQPDAWCASFEVEAEPLTQVYADPQEPCAFTVRLRNRSEEDRALQLRYVLTNLDGTMVWEGEESVVAPAMSRWEKQLDLKAEAEGLYTLVIILHSGESTLRANVDFAVETGASPTT